MKDFRNNFFLILITAVATSGISMYIQRNFVTKAEENNLLRELIPSLTSNEPAQVDMALLILEKTINKNDYEIIKSIIDSKLKSIVVKSIAPISVKNNIQLSANSNKSSKSKILAYASQREDWKEMINEKEYELIKPLYREDMLKILDSLDSRASESVDRVIYLEIAKKINAGNYFLAIIGLDWVLRKRDDERYSLLKGILKSNLKNDQRNLLNNYFSQNGNEQIAKLLKQKAIERLEKLNLKDEIELIRNEPGWAIYKMNIELIDNFKNEKSFQDVFLRAPEKYKSKFDNVR